MKKFYYKFMAIAAGLLLNASLLYSQDVSNLVNQATTTVKSTGQQIVNLVSAIIGVVGALMLAWNFYKRAKGDQQSNDALMGWGSSLLFAALFLQIIKAALL